MSNRKHLIYLFYTHEYCLFENIDYFNVNTSPFSIYINLSLFIIPLQWKSYRLKCNYYTFSWKKPNTPQLHLEQLPDVQNHSEPPFHGSSLDHLHLYRWSMRMFWVEFGYMFLSGRLLLAQNQFACQCRVLPKNHHLLKHAS